MSNLAWIVGVAAALAVVCVGWFFIQTMLRIASQVEEFQDEWWDDAGEEEQP